MDGASVICGLLLLLATGSASGQTGASVQVELERPRNFGYFTGDLLELRASVRVPQGFTLDARTLEPAAQPAWLEVRRTGWKVRRASEALSYEFHFVFQVFDAPDSVTRLTVPERHLVFRSERSEEPLKVLIPQFHFSLSPLTDSTSAMEPDWQLRPSNRWIKLSAGALTLLLGLLGASVAVDQRRRRRHVFWQAHRTVQGAQDCGEALLVLHRALEERAGKALFADDLDALAERWRAANRMRGDLERFFELSEAFFYGSDGGRGSAERSAECLRWVRQFSKRLMEEERRIGAGDAAGGTAARR